jgi:hypothetical protein
VSPADVPGRRPNAAARRDRPADLGDAARWIPVAEALAEAPPPTERLLARIRAILYDEGVVSPDQGGAA